LAPSSIADPDLVLAGAPIKLFTVFYILVGIGILVELVRQLGFAYVEVRRAEKAARAAKETTQPKRNPRALVARQRLRRHDPVVERSRG
jgi:hypothetical protein